jgi:hypothetical protein
MQKALDHSKELYNEDWKNYSNMTGYKISEDKKWVDAFNETIISELTGFNTLEESQEVF